MFGNLIYDLKLAGRIYKVLHHNFIQIKIDKLPYIVNISYLNLASMESEFHMSKKADYHCLRIYRDNYNYYGIKNITEEKYIQIHRDKIYNIYNKLLHWREVARHYIVSRGSDFFDSEKYEQFVKDIELMEKEANI